jgi:hypothetical protein
MGIICMLYHGADAKCKQDRFMVGGSVGEVPLLMFVHIGPSRVGTREGTSKTRLILAICTGFVALLSWAPQLDFQ